MDALREFLAMGGYAAYVWTSFAVALLLIGGVELFAMRQLVRVRRDTFRSALLRDSREAGHARDAATSGTPTVPAGR